MLSSISYPGLTLLLNITERDHDGGTDAVSSVDANIASGA